ncbi:MAG: CapA family protein [Bacteriovorax sp.]
MKMPNLALVLFLSLQALQTLRASERDLTYSTPCDSKNNQIALSFVGDILIHKALYEVVDQETKHFSQIWNKTDKLISKADFSAANLEGPAALGIDQYGKDHGDIGFVYDGYVYSGTNFLFNYHPRILSDLRSSGYDLITTANNHALDRTSLGIDKTITAAQAVGLFTVGTRQSNDTSGAFYKIASINSLRVAFLGCTEMTNDFNDTKDQILFCFKNPSRILGIIKELSLRNDVDAIVVMPHWGTEYSPTPNEEQKAFARKYIDAGATMVIGSHPHVLQPWEKYVASDGREALILYSLGNFVAGQAGLARKTGTVAYIGLSKQGNQRAKIFGVGYTPTFRNGASLFPIGSSDSKSVIDHVASMFGSRARVEPDGHLMTVMCSK